MDLGLDGARALVFGSSSGLGRAVAAALTAEGAAVAVVSRDEERADEACRAIGRDPSTLARSAMSGVLIGRTRDEVEARERALLEAFGSDAETGEAWLEERRTRWIYGTPDEALAQVKRFADAGLERLMFQSFLPWDLDMIDLIADELVGRV